MSSLKGDEAIAHVRALREKADADTARRLASAKLDAKKRGKESFDFAKLAKLMDVRSDLTHQAHDDDDARLEREYYLVFPSAKTLAQFVELRARAIVDG